MALTTNFNQDPYYDDFNDNKNYYTYAGGHVGI